MKSEEGSVKKGSENSLVRGLRVLECFASRKQEQGCTLSELARELNIPKASMQRILRNLTQMHYLRYEELSKRYHLGVRVLSLGFAVLEGLELREIAKPYLENLSRECNKTVNLAILDADEMIYVERTVIRGIRSYNISIGKRIHLWSTAIGKAVLAHMKPEEVIKMMKKAKKNGVFTGNEDTFLKVLAMVRKNGFALNDADLHKSLVVIAVPVFSPTGVVGAINLFGEPEDVSPETLSRDYAPKLMKVGKQLSEALGYRKQG